MQYELGWLGSLWRVGRVVGDAFMEGRFLDRLPF